MRLLAPATSEPQRGVTLDAEQAHAVAAALAGQGLLIAGAPGSGKTLTLTQLAIAALNRGSQAGNTADVLFLTATRRAAGELRNQITSQIERPLSAPVLRTPSALAFAILKTLAAAKGEPEPRLISGPEQDRILADLLAGHLVGDGVELPMPPGLQPEVLTLRGFRNEVRDLLMRAREHGITPTQLTKLARRYQRPMWEFGAAIYAEYEANLALRAFGFEVGRQIDPAGLVADAASALANWFNLTDAPPPQFGMVIVDDYQEATAATAQLLGELQKLGSQLVIAGNPDLATQGFRGANPALFPRATAPKGSELGAFGLEPLKLTKVWRAANANGGAELVQATEKITSRIPTVGGPSSRGAVLASGGPTEADAAPSGVTVVQLRGRAQEAAWIAAELRREHYLNQTPWEQMAVICRSGAQLSDLRRDLLGAGVPVSALGADVPLHQEPAVMPFLTMLQMVSGAVLLTLEVLLELFASPVANIDAIAQRRLRQALIVQERVAGGSRNSDQLLVDAVGDQTMRDSLGELGAGLNRISEALAAGFNSMRTTPDIGSVLWAIWSATGLAETWREAALEGGSFGLRADRDLDSMMALFKAAEFYAERNPGAGPVRFVEYLQSQDVPADSVAIKGSLGSVSALTPTGAAGREWDLVVVAGVQEGVWPDLRLRDSMFGTQTLVDAVTGRALPEAVKDVIAARAEVMADETRAFAVAVSRVRRRLIVTAVDGPDEAPSTYLNVLADHIVPVEPGPPLDLRGVVATARVAALGGRAMGNDAAELLASLWAAGVAEANPENWYGVNQISTTAPLWDADGPPVPVSPSKVEAVINCPLRWAFESAGASAAAGVSQNLGTLIHALAQAFPAGTYEQLREELDRRWPELDLGEGWSANRERVKAEAMVYRLAKYLETASPAAAVEADFKLNLGSAIVAGRADRIEDLGNDLYQIVDLKTGATMPSLADSQENPQLQTYQLALAEGAFSELPDGATTGGAHLLFVSNGKEGTLRKQGKLDAAGQQAAHQLVLEVAETMAGSEFVAQLNVNCRNCALKFTCPLQPQSRRVIE